ncbi:MAG: hypothetical protein KC561_04615 [Myxococcales bacterium]|nr:hypothetical protein [Myxococcales bacterium]
MAERVSQSINNVLPRLYAEYGQESWRADERDILSVLVRAVIGQATSKPNANTAFQQLLATFDGDWNVARKAAVENVVEAISIAGLAEQRAPRILAILDRCYQTFAEVHLEPLRSYPTSRAYDFLESLPGVGPKTAAFVLMLTTGADLLPVNGGIHRLAKRLGLVPPNTSAVRTQNVLSSAVPVGEGYSAHMALVVHARRICTSRNPDCIQCCLADLCPRIGVNS